MSDTVSGVLHCLKQGGGFLRNPERSFQIGREDVWVSNKTIREYRLVDGADIIGKRKKGKKGFELVDIESVCGLTPVEFRSRKRFENLIPIDPNDRFRLGDGGNTTMRIVELIAPIGKGTRGLIVAQPKAGKTQILEDLANAINECDPETRIVVLLIDERPEEVTHFSRQVKAEVLASSNDQSLQSHVNLAEITLGHIRCDLECGRDVVVLVDSLTRMARAFNLNTSSGRGMMSGGLSPQALEIPRKFFGMARNIENGGSVTVIATALVDTGSRMDDFIFEEFKGTGNSEIVLNRSLADSRIFPAIDIAASGTRKEHLLFNENEMKGVVALRRYLADKELKDGMNNLLRLVNSDPTNAELLKRPKMF